MGKYYFTDDQVELLKKNKYVNHVSNKSITYTLEFKNLFISEYGTKSATVIFKKLVFQNQYLDMRELKLQFQGGKNNIMNVHL